MKIPHLDVLISAPVGLYPLRRDTQTRVRVFEATYKEIGAREKESTGTARVFTLYSQNLFSIMAQFCLRRYAGSAWRFENSMRKVGNECLFLPRDQRDTLDFVEEEAVRLLICEVLEGMLAIDTSAPTDAQNYHPWQFLVPETHFAQRPLELSSPVSVPSRAGPPIQKYVYSRVPF